MKIQFGILLIFASTFLFGQDTLKMDYFSSEYKLLILSNKCDMDSCFGETYITIFNRKTNKPISTIKVEKFIADNSYVTRGKTSNQIPNPIWYDDYNFDNIIDIAIRNGFSDNGKSKYDYYIKNSTFELDTTLTNISKNKGYVFTLPEKKQLELVFVNENDYRIREFYAYKNLTKKLVIIERITEDGKTNPKFIIVTTERFIEGVKTTSKKKYLKEKYLWSEI